MGHWKQMFSGSDYLAAAEFGDRLFTAKIARAESVVVEEDNGKSKRKGVIHFAGQQKGWMLCKTNAMCVAAMFGDDPKDWVGKSVTLYATMVQVGKTKELGIRVKGSPDIEEPVACEIKLPRKRPFTVRLVKTGAAKANGANGHTKPADEQADADGVLPDAAPEHDGADIQF